MVHSEPNMLLDWSCVLIGTAVRGVTFDWWYNEQYEPAGQSSAGNRYGLVFLLCHETTGSEDLLKISSTCEGQLPYPAVPLVVLVTFEQQLHMHDAAVIQCRLLMNPADLHVIVYHEETEPRVNCLCLKLVILNSVELAVAVTFLAHLILIGWYVYTCLGCHC